MTRFFAALAAALLLIGAGHLYPQAYTVTAVDPLPDWSAVLTLETADGNLWQVHGDGDCEAGQVLTGIAFDGWTRDDVTDDVILALRWSGWTMEGMR